MNGGFRKLAVALPVAMAFLSGSAAMAGDDGAAPLWVGVGSIFSPLLGFSLGGKEEKEPIEYREHGKIVVPPKIDLPPPGAAAPETGAAWPVNQETVRKRIAKEAAKKEIAGQGDARLRYTHPFPNAPVTIRAEDQVDPSICPHGKCESAPASSSLLGSLNPLSWIGMGKSASALGPEPDREWLTDPPKGYRAPLSAPVGGAASAAGSAAK